MIKLEALKTAHSASTGGKWVRLRTRHGDFQVWGHYGTDQEHVLATDMCEGNARFITLAHNMMPALLEAVDLMERGYELATRPWAEDFRAQVLTLREKLK